MSSFSLRALPATAAARLAVGLGQGLALAVLYLLAEDKLWPATHGLVFAPLLLIAWFVPIVALIGIGNLRPRTLLITAISITVLLAALAAHDIDRGAEANWWGAFSGGGSDQHIWPSAILTGFTALGLFIAVALIVAGDAEQHLVAAYPRYFDVAWKHAVQLALAGLFLGLFWILLTLGAALFTLIHIQFFQRLIGHRFFALPVSTLALACAIHVTDVRAAIVRGLRGLLHVLLSWLLPIAVLIVAGFLVSLPFTGLDPLWRTRFATSLLLSVAAVLVVLINAVYQDGQPDHPPPRLLRYAASLGCVMLAPMIAIASYALWLRIVEYGWTTDRIIATACLVVAGCYAAGYLWAVLRPGLWLAALERCNLTAAALTLAILLALFTPIADPARLSVASQMALLQSGTIPPEKFDFNYLRFRGARYGRAALEQLTQYDVGANPAYVRQRAAAALKAQTPWQREATAPAAADLVANVAVYPRGRELPQSFAQQDWAARPWLGIPAPWCLNNRTAKCDAFLVDLDGDGKDEIVVMDSTSFARAVAFAEASDGSWRPVGMLSVQSQCKGVREALQAGDFTLTDSAWKDLTANGQRLHLEATGSKCP